MVDTGEPKALTLVAHPTTQQSTMAAARIAGRVTSGNHLRVWGMTQEVRFHGLVPNCLCPSPSRLELQAYRACCRPVQFSAALFL